MKNRAQLIRAAATQDVSAEEWRDRLDEWLDIHRPMMILWRKTVDVFEQSPNFWALFKKMKP